MGSYKLELSKTADDDLKKIKKSGKKIDLKKIETLLSELEEHPKTGTGSPEQMKHYQGEVWSRRVNKKDRMVYEIIDDKVVVFVYNFLGHYTDK